MTFDELLNNVQWRLCAEDAKADDGYDHQLLLPAYGLSLAKMAARKGDLEPLRRLYPEIADCLKAPPRGKRVRRNPYLPFKQDVRREQLSMIKRIRKAIEEETGQACVKPKLLNDIAAKILECIPDHVGKIIKRGT